MTAAHDEILVVEDVSGVARLYRHWLQDAGYAVERTSGVDLGDVLGRTDADVVILDKGHLECLLEGTVAGFPPSDEPHKVVLTIGVRPSPDVVALPFHDYLLKTVSRPELLDAVDGVLACRAYDDTIGEFAAAVNKVTLAGQETTANERAESDAYRTLVDRLEELYERIRSEIGGLDETAIDDIFSDDAAVLARDPTPVLNARPS